MTPDEKVLVARAERAEAEILELTMRLAEVRGFWIAATGVDLDAVFRWLRDGDHYPFETECEARRHFANAVVVAAMTFLKGTEGLIAALDAYRAQGGGS
jgi:hypothetical protein